MLSEKWKFSTKTHTKGANRGVQWVLLKPMHSITRNTLSYMVHYMLVICKLFALSCTAPNAHLSYSMATLEAEILFEKGPISG